MCQLDYLVEYLLVKGDVDIHDLEYLHDLFKEGLRICCLPNLSWYQPLICTHEILLFAPVVLSAVACNELV